MKLHISLDEVKPKVWRRVVVPPSLTLGDLHHVIQGVMPWTDSHLHKFTVGEDLRRRRFGVSYSTASFIKVADEDDDDDEEDEEYSNSNKTRNEDSVTLGALATEGHTSITYVYDMGDSWRHKIVFEGGDVDVGGKDATSSIRCIGGRMACPPDDCGGPYGYMDMVDAMADASHPDHEDMVETAGGEEFDPREFGGSKAVTQRLTEFLEWRAPHVVLRTTQAAS